MTAIAMEICGRDFGNTHRIDLVAELDQADLTVKIVAGGALEKSPRIVAHGGGCRVVEPGRANGCLIAVMRNRAAAS